MPKWIKCMNCREVTSFCPSEPKYHRLLIDLVGKAQRRAAAQVKEEEDAIDSTDKGEEREAKRPKFLSTTAPPLARVKEEPADDNDDDTMGPNDGGNISGIDVADSGGSDDNIVWFLYKGRPDTAIPQDISHARIDPSVKIIAAYAFAYCVKLVEVEVSEGLVVIEVGAFHNCKSLTRMKVPSTVKKIGNSAFYNCEQLVEVELYEGLKVIGMGAFNGCKSLIHFKSPSSVKTIGYKAFWGCERLEVVELSEGLEEIGDWAFHRCDSLKSIEIPSTVKVIPKHLKSLSN